MEPTQYGSSDPRGRDCGCSNPHYRPWAEDWMGHCLSASYASAVLRQPVPNTPALTSEQLEGLWIEAAQVSPYRPALDAGQRCRQYVQYFPSDASAVPLQSPTAAAGEAVDLFAADLHDTLYQGMYFGGELLVADLRCDSCAPGDYAETRNHVIYKFNAVWEQLSPAQATSLGLSGGNAVRIVNEIHANIDTHPSGNATDGLDHDECVDYPCYDGAAGRATRRRPSATCARACADVGWRDRIVIYEYALVFDGSGTAVDQPGYENFISVSKPGGLPPGVLMFLPGHVRGRLFIDMSAASRSPTFDNVQVTGDRVSALDAANGTPDACRAGGGDRGDIRDRRTR